MRIKVGEEFIPYKLFVGAIIPNCIMKYPDLTPSAKIAWARLAQFAGKDGHCYPSYETLAREVGLKRRQVINVVNELIEKKFIRKDTPSSADSKRNHETNKFHFLWHSCFETDGALLPGVMQCTGDVHSNAPGGGALECTQRESIQRESIRKESIKRHTRHDLPAREMDECVVFSNSGVKNGETGGEGQESLPVKKLGTYLLRCGKYSTEFNEDQLNELVHNIVSHDKSHGCNIRNEGAYSNRIKAHLVDGDFNWNGKEHLFPGYQGPGPNQRRVKEADFSKFDDDEPIDHETHLRTYHEAIARFKAA